MTIEYFNEPFRKTNKQTMNGTLYHILLIYCVIISQSLTFALFYMLYCGFGVKYSMGNYFTVMFFVFFLSEICLGIRPYEQINEDMIKKYKNEKNPKLKSWLISISVIILFISSFFAMYWVLAHVS